MYQRTLTLEERERFAYIEGRTHDAELLTRALEGDDELQQQVSRLEEENKDLESKHDAEFDRAERAEESIADLEERVSDLKGQIEAAGVDLV